MITLSETASGIYGAWRLAHGDRQGLVFFDASVPGFWKSFFAAVLVLPIYGLLVGLGRPEAAPEITAGPLRQTAVHLIAYVMDWTAFPLAMTVIAPMLGRPEHYIRYIVALNWAKVLEASVLLPAAAVAALVPTGAGALIPLAAFVAVLVYHWYVAKSGLGVSGPEAVLVVGVNVTLGVVITLWARALVT